MPKSKPKSKSVVKVPSWKPLELFAHQRAVVAAHAEGILRFFLGWHRRAGKDVFALDFARERMQERVGSYWHLFPFHVQAKRAIWKGIDARTGQRFIDRAFPKHMRHGEQNDTDMSLTLKHPVQDEEPGSTWQMLGSDNYDRMVGSNPCGIIFSEWALCDPAAWDYIRPILIENNGWAMFITTFRGRNHAWRMFNNVKDLDGWYAEIRDITRTRRNDGSYIIDPKRVEQAATDEKIRPELIQQEFYCNPDAASIGAVFTRQYGRLMQLDPMAFRANNKAMRIAWGKKDEGIAAIAYQGHHIIGVHTFCETNFTDAAQAVARRHPNMPIIHHAVDADPTLFNVLDGAGVVNAQLTGDTHWVQGHAAAMLNTCAITSVARESLADFAMDYTPFREKHIDEQDEERLLTYDAITQALAVMHHSQPYAAQQRKKPDYSKYDRSVI